MKNFKEFVEKTLEKRRGYAYGSYNTRGCRWGRYLEVFSLAHYNTEILRVELDSKWEGRVTGLSYEGFSFSDKQAVCKTMCKLCAEMLFESDIAFSTDFNRVLLKTSDESRRLIYSFDDYEPRIMVARDGKQQIAWPAKLHLPPREVVEKFSELFEPRVREGKMDRAELKFRVAFLRREWLKNKAWLPGLEAREHDVFARWDFKRKLLA